MFCIDKSFHLRGFFVLLAMFFCSFGLAIDAVDASETISQSINVVDAVDTTKAVVGVASDAAPEVAQTFLKKLLLKVKGLFVKAADAPVPGPLDAVKGIVVLSWAAKDAACAAKSRIYPSNEEALKAIKIAREHEALLAKKTLEQCLIQNVRSKRGPSGRPEVCEEVARMFVMAAGVRELEKTTKIYNQMCDTYEPDEIFNFDIVDL